MANGKAKPATADLLSEAHSRNSQPRISDMNIRQALTDEHSRRQTTAIVEFIGGDSRRFAELMKLCFAGEYRLTQRAAWPMSYCAERRPELIRPCLPKLIDCLERD